MNILLQVVAGLMYSLVLWIIVSGFMLKFSNLRIPDFAHASLYMLGAYASYSVATLLGNSTLGFFVAMVVSFISLSLVGGLVEVLLLRRLYKAEHILQALITFALVLVIADVVRLGWGLQPMIMSKPEFLRGSFDFAGYTLPDQYILILSVAVIVGVALWFLIYRTRAGAVIRAITSDPEMASGLGINVPRWTTGIFMLGSGLAGLGGSLIVLQSALGPGMDLAVSFNLFIVIIIGGMGSMLGCLIAVLLLGQLNSIGTVFFPDLSMAIPFLLMAAVLVVRPWGLLGKPER